VTSIRKPNRRRLGILIEAASGQRCDATGKVRHPTQQAAREVLAELLHRPDDPDRELLVVFRCRRCGDWHVGHREAP